MSTAMSVHILNVFRLFPKLGSHLRKGDCGKIAVVGGSAEYTGAPYFASLITIKLGGDLAYVFCHPDAAPAIKSYSPELIVYPSQELEQIKTVISRIDSLIIGPGLGRDPKLVPLMKQLLNHAKKERQLGVVIDADGLFHVAECLDQLRNCSRVILTPNHHEFKRLYQKVFQNQQIGKITIEHVQKLSKNLGVNVFCKGKEDIITNGKKVLIGEEWGTGRRCGGQGDLLSGAIALFIYWEKMKTNVNELDSTHILNGARCASDFIRYVSRYTFDRMGRSMSAADILEHVPYVVKEFDTSVKY